MGAVNLLSDRRPIRAMEGSVNQVQMFKLHGKFNPRVEGIASVRDINDALNVSKVYTTVMCNFWVRTKEFGVYHRDPKAPLGSEIIYVEKGVRYIHLVPDVPVQFDGKEISLRKAVAMGVYDSIDLLKVEQTNISDYTVSAVDLAALAGKVRAVDFMRNSWALTDEHGFPLASQPASSSNLAARHGWTGMHFEDESNGWQGSPTLDAITFDGRDVFMGCGWPFTPKVAIVGHSAVAPLETTA